MSEIEKEPESPSAVELKEPASPKNQLVALLTLLPVLAVLWLVIQYLPKFGDWMGAKADSVVSAVSGEGGSSPDANGPEGPSSQDESINAVAALPAESGQSILKKSPIESHGSVSDSTPMKAGFEAQIIDQLGGSGKVAMRHLAISDDNERMVAALKINDESGGNDLIEVFFDRDEFGRFVSTEDSPVSEKLVIWSE